MIFVDFGFMLGIVEWGNSLGLIGVIRICFDYDVFKVGFINCFMLNFNDFCLKGYENVLFGMCCN